MTRIKPQRLNHMNFVVQDFGDSLQQFRDAFDAELILDLPHEAMHAGLITVGRVIFELFAPGVYLLNARYGPHYLGVEYQADMEEVRSALAERGIRIVRGGDIALHVHPDDAFGVALEFYAGEFHSGEWPLIGGPIKPSAYWRDSHALGIGDQYGYAVTVRDIVRASAFFQDLLSAQMLSDEICIPAAARVIRLRIADTTMELLTPTADGPLERHLARYGDGILSTIIFARDLEEMRRQLCDRGLAVEEGSLPGRLAVTVGDHGPRIEFMSQSSAS